jgi:hypothetical protein
MFRKLGESQRGRWERPNKRRYVDSKTLICRDLYVDVGDRAGHCFARGKADELLQASTGLGQELAEPFLWLEQSRFARVTGRLASFQTLELNVRYFCLNSTQPRVFP